MALTIAAPVMNGDEIVAAVVAVVSFRVSKQSSNHLQRARASYWTPVCGCLRGGPERQSVAHPDAAMHF